MKKRLGCFVLLAIFTAACSKQEQSVSASAVNTETTVATVRVMRSNLTGAVTLTGEFIPFQEVDVMAKVAGYIRKMNVDVGDRVHQGQVLATLEVPEMENDMARASAGIDQANAEAVRAEADVHRLESGQENDAPLAYAD